MLGPLRSILCLLALLLAPASGFAQAAPLTFGVFPYVSPGQLLEFHTPLKTYLEHQLKRPVDLVTAPDFVEFMERTRKGEYDLVLTAPHMGRLAETRDGYQRLVMTGHDVTGIFLVRQDSEIRQIADLKGKTLMVAQPISVIYQMTVAHLRKHGLEPGRDLTLIDTKTHNNALYAPARHEADASVTGILLWSKAEPALRAQLREIGHTDTVPGFLILAHERLGPATIKQLQKLLLAYPDTEEGRAYFSATDLKSFRRVDDKTMKALDPYTAVLLKTSKP